MHDWIPSTAHLSFSFLIFRGLRWILWMGISNSWPELLKLVKGRQCNLLGKSLFCFDVFLEMPVPLNLSTENIKSPADRYSIQSKHQFAKRLREPSSKFEIFCGTRGRIRPPTETAHFWHLLVRLVTMSQEHGINHVCVEGGIPQRSFRWLCFSS